MRPDWFNPKQKPAPHLHNVKWARANSWTRCTFNPINLNEVHAWIKENTKGQYSLSIASVRFEDPKEATFFKLAFVDHD